MCVVLIDSLFPDPVVCAWDGKLAAEGGLPGDVRVVNDAEYDHVVEAHEVSGHTCLTVIQLAATAMEYDW